MREADQSSVNDIRATQRGWNPKTLKVLRSRGVDLSKPLRVFNDFHVYREAEVTSLQATLIAAGFYPESVSKFRVDDSEPYWSVIASLELVPELTNIDRMTDRCAELVLGLHGTYDGWYVELEK